MVPLFYNARSLWARRLSTGLTVLGLGLVVFVFSAVLMLANGIESALASGGDAANAVMLRKGATGELVSGVERDAVRALATDPAVAASGPRGAAGGRRAGGAGGAASRGAAPMNTTARGVAPESFTARPEVRLVSGRAPRPGTNEVALGRRWSDAPGATLGGDWASPAWALRRPCGRLRLGRAPSSPSCGRDASGWARPSGGGAYSSAIVRLALPGTWTPSCSAWGRTRASRWRRKPEPAYWAYQASGLATSSACWACSCPSSSAWARCWGRW